MKVSFLTEQGSMLPSVYRSASDCLGTRVAIDVQESRWPASPALCQQLLAAGSDQVVLGYPATSQAIFMGKFTTEAQRTQGGTVVTKKLNDYWLHDTRAMAIHRALKILGLQWMGKRALVLGVHDPARAACIALKERLHFEEVVIANPGGHGFPELSIFGTDNPQGQFDLIVNTIDWQIHDVPAFARSSISRDTVVMDCIYKPSRMTPILKFAEQKGCNIVDATMFVAYRVFGAHYQLFGIEMKEGSQAEADYFSQVRSLFEQRGL
jgi:shikimate 5-dehydrogenase